MIHGLQESINTLCAASSKDSQENISVINKTTQIILEKQLEKPNIIFGGTTIFRWKAGIGLVLLTTVVVLGGKVLLKRG